MQLYMFISIAVVLLSTVVLFFIFQRNNLKDLRYTVGLVFSAVIACAGSLFFPGFVAILSANNALRFFIVFFLSILIYIFILFIVLILVFQIVSKEKVDALVQKWEERKLKKKIEKEQRRIEKEAQAAKTDAGLAGQEQAASSDSHTLPSEKTEAAALQQGSADTAIAHEAVNTFVETGAQSSNEIAGVSVEQPVLDQSSTVRTTDSISVETSAQSSNEIAGAAEDQPASDQPSIIRTIDETSVESNVQSGTEGAVEPEDLFASVQPADLSYEAGPFGMIGQDAFSEEEQKTESAESLSFSSADLQDKIESNEKIVDTSNIIDKMGIDAVTDSAHPVPEQQGNSLTEIIQKAFLLKQQGDIMEAAALYMAALDQKPDNETAFWIVLDICAIYKNTGHADLAEDILLTYIDTFEHLMSEEVKDQILHCLYEG